ncbi:MAG: penicillin-binding protein 1B [Pseudomonadota bacterium]|nr:penicillin-binding protein 1B [Pseudomonadota bacterium]
MKKAARSKEKTSGRRSIRAWIAIGVAVSLGLLAGYTAYLNHVVTERFDGRRWALPSQVYARPLELYSGAVLQAESLRTELERLGYRRTSAVAGAGTYQPVSDGFRIHTRAFQFWDGSEPSRIVRIAFRDGQVVSIKDQNGRPLKLLRLDPLLIGSIHTQHAEDRVLVRLGEVPPLLLTALMLVEDRRFPDHIGLDFRAIFRAMWVNLRARRIVQGGSTLTQQLVKNYFLDNDRTLRRKFNEAIMAMLLEWHYGKDEILEAYLNEVYLAQDGQRAVHGFGLASQFYFRKPLNELGPHQLALLVAIVKGPSYYDPRRHPERSRVRRDQVLGILAEHGVIDAPQAQQAKRQPIGLATGQGRPDTFPAFVDLVRRQLRVDYRAEDLTSEGLRVFTTLDPGIQEAVEKAVSRRLPKLEQQYAVGKDRLQAAAVVSDVHTGEVRALVGGRDAGYAGFNRSLDAKRPVGSLVKPFVFLTALARSSDYHLATLVDDSAIRVTLSDGQVWAPDNFGGQFHGTVPLFEALAGSYNAATVRVGLDVGAGTFATTLRDLGFERDMPAYPSLFLGAVEMSPLQVAELYHTLASGGFRPNLRAIREVLTADGVPLQRYSVAVRRVAPAAPVYLTVNGMQEVVRRGTGRSLNNYLSTDLAVAGKTGTTDDFRDSWFAGFTGDHLAVVWLGRDDNQPVGLTGATGALTVWGEAMAKIPTRPLDPVPPSGIEHRWVDEVTGQWSAEACPGAVELPFLEGTGPETATPCGRQPSVRPERLLERVRRWFR